MFEELRKHDLPFKASATVGKKPTAAMYEPRYLILRPLDLCLMCALRVCCPDHLVVFGVRADSGASQVLFGQSKRGDVSFEGADTVLPSIRLSEPGEVLRCTQQKPPLLFVRELLKKHSATVIACMRLPIIPTG